MGIFDFIKKMNSPAGIEVTEIPGIVLQPIDGEIISLTDIGDGVFSEGILGGGCGLIPDGEVVYAPVSGTISTVIETNHAVGIEADGVEILIHVGLETVSMDGRGFDMKVKKGDKVRAGQVLYTFSLEEMKKTEGVKTTSAVLIVNSAELPAFEVLRTGCGKAGDKLFRVK